MASARKQKDTAVPIQPTRGRIHIFTVCPVLFPIFRRDRGVDLMLGWREGVEQQARLGDVDTRFGRVQLNIFTRGQLPAERERVLVGRC